MIAKRLKRPRDPVQLGKLIGDILTGEVEDALPARAAPEAHEFARKGGLKGEGAGKGPDFETAVRDRKHRRAGPLEEVLARFVFLVRRPADVDVQRQIHRQIDLFLVRIYGIPMILVVLNQDTVADHLFAAVSTKTCASALV